MADQLFDASFRGVPFLVEGANDSFGNHNVIHEFPGRKPRIDPNGPMPDRFRLDCHLIGPNYQSELQRLEDALRQPGPGRLVHHFRGSFLVTTDGEITVTQTTREGGMAKLTVTFIVAGDEETPSLRIETFDLVITEGDIAQAAMADRVGEAFDVAGDDKLVERSTSIIEDVQTFVADANASIQSMFGPGNGTPTASIASFGSNIASIINTPHTMATTISSLIGAVFRSISDAVQAVDEIDPLGDVRRVYGALMRGRQIVEAMGLFRDGNAFGDDYATPAENTPIQVQRALNQRLLVQTTRVAVIVSACATVARVGAENTRQASRVFTQISDAIEDLRGDLDDATSVALVNLRGAIGQHLRVSAAQLPDAVDYTPKNTVPALLLAQTLYGDPTREAEIVERNAAIEHPGFIRGGVAIEVLSA